MQTIFNVTIWDVLICIVITQNYNNIETLFANVTTRNVVVFSYRYNTKWDLVINVTTWNVNA